MGVERQIRIAAETPIAWDAIRSRLLAVGETPAMRMIDSEPAFPDEDPPPNWQELRIALHGGMVTLRRTPDGVSCITWGNADAALIRSWNLLFWAVAFAASGLVVNDRGEVTAEEFAALERLFVA